ncbi:hypothetical protein L228DRAFT_236983 [Xylona heveae TC161]|uniref:Uncharacterized protein n=1 Tax=Xylona heveae (strain CBS 132557 / TC161) TaxID=1328760 RepID=A0A165HW53_XYLHT|nr:hypothetical protein L228DRAFT_236983 [Xylona heveae TC161]KZF24009.1 hypothetical protein L228DRAFT_236983 [Xylona heveae TC161]
MPGQRQNDPGRQRADRDRRRSSGLFVSQWANDIAGSLPGNAPVQFQARTQGQGQGQREASPPEKYKSRLERDVEALLARREAAEEKQHKQADERAARYARFLARRGPGRDTLAHETRKEIIKSHKELNARKARARAAREAERQRLLGAFAEAGRRAASLPASAAIPHLPARPTGPIRTRGTWRVRLTRTTRPTGDRQRRHFKGGDRGTEEEEEVQVEISRTDNGEGANEDDGEAGGNAAGEQQDDETLARDLQRQYDDEAENLRRIEVAESRRSRRGRGTLNQDQPQPGPQPPASRSQSRGRGRGRPRGRGRGRGRGASQPGGSRHSSREVSSSPAPSQDQPAGQTRGQAQRQTQNQTTEEERRIRRHRLSSSSSDLSDPGSESSSEMGDTIVVQPLAQPQDVPNPALASEPAPVEQPQLEQEQQEQAPAAPAIEIPTLTPQTTTEYKPFTLVRVGGSHPWRLVLPMRLAVGGYATAQDRRRYQRMVALGWRQHGNLSTFDHIVRRNCIRNGIEPGWLLADSPHGFEYDSETESSDEDEYFGPSGIDRDVIAVPDEVGAGLSILSAAGQLTGPGAPTLPEQAQPQPSAGPAGPVPRSSGISERFRMERSFGTGEWTIFMPEGIALFERRVGVEELRLLREMALEMEQNHPLDNSWRIALRRAIVDTASVVTQRQFGMIVAPIGESILDAPGLAMLGQLAGQAERLPFDLMPELEEESEGGLAILGQLAGQAEPLQIRPASQQMVQPATEQHPPPIQAGSLPLHQTTHQVVEPTAEQPLPAAQNVQSYIAPPVTGKRKAEEKDEGEENPKAAEEERSPPQKRRKVSEVPEASDARPSATPQARTPTRLASVGGVLRRVPRASRRLEQGGAGRTGGATSASIAAQTTAAAARPAAPSQAPAHAPPPAPAASAIATEEEDTPIVKEEEATTGPLRLPDFPGDDDDDEEEQPPTIRSRRNTRSLSTRPFHLPDFPADDDDDEEEENDEEAAEGAEEEEEGDASAPSARRQHTLLSTIPENERMSERLHLDRGPAERGKPDPSKLSITITKGNKTKTQRYKHPVDWNDSASVVKLNRWRQQQFRRATGEIARAGAVPYTPEENQFLIDVTRQSLANKERTINWRRVLNDFNARFEGQALPSSDVPRPRRTRDSLISQRGRIPECNEMLGKNPRANEQAGKQARSAKSRTTTKGKGKGKTKKTEEEEEEEEEEDENDGEEEAEEWNGVKGLKHQEGLES